MKLIKKINNNVALGLDTNGREIVVFGKGIGFNKMPYELTDLSLVHHTYYDIDKKYVGLLEEIPTETLLVANEIVEYGKIYIDEDLNPNLVLTLADHINFSIERYIKNMNICLPYSFDLERDYPEAFEVAAWGLDKIEEKLDVRLPENEKFSIAMHFINAYKGKVNNRDSYLTIEIIKHVVKIVEDYFNIKVDTKTSNYYRFTNHINRFIERRTNEDNNDIDNTFFNHIINNYNDIYQCVLIINNYFKEILGSGCCKDDLVYLIIHVNALTHIK